MWMCCASCFMTLLLGVFKKGKNEWHGLSVFRPELRFWVQVSAVLFLHDSRRPDVAE